MSTWRTVVAGAVAAGLEPAAARWLGEQVSGASGSDWSEALDTEVSARHLDQFSALLDRRLGGEPLQYVLGSWAFRRLDLLIDRRVLIPRPETEWVVERALGLLPAGPATVVDLGTGSGAIALAIAEERWPHVRVVATDVSPAALEVARANLAGLGQRGTAVSFHQGSWWEAVPADLHGSVDLVVSNPPYVAADEPLPLEVTEWEPPMALVSGPTGLEAIGPVLAGAVSWLRPGGWLVCEIGETQGPDARALALEAGLDDVRVELDLAGKERMVVGQRPPRRS